MYDLVCVVPLYGKNCEDTSLRMVSSLALQKAIHKIKYKFYYDDTVSEQTLSQIKYLLDNRNIDYDITYSELTCSGHKRNMGIKYAIENSKYIWLVDQDDYLLRNDTLEVIISICLHYNLDIFKVSYSVPDNIGKGNEDTIRTIPTMPWQYVVRTDLLEGYAFDEVMEYGSDVPFSIRLLVMNKYMKVNKDLSVSYVKVLPAIEHKLYFYNYLNEDSYMYYHAVAGSEVKEDQREKAFAEIAKVKEEFEAKYGDIYENN